MQCCNKCDKKKKKKLSVASFVLDLVKNKVLFVSFAFGNISLPEQ